MTAGASRTNYTRRQSTILDMPQRRPLPLVDTIKRGSSHTRFLTPIWSRITEWPEGMKLQVCMLLLVLLDVALVLLQRVYDGMSCVDHLALIISIIFLCEIAYLFMEQGPEYSKDLWNVVDAFIVLLVFVVYFIGPSLSHCVLALRLLRYPSVITQLSLNSTRFRRGNRLILKGGKDIEEGSWELDLSYITERMIVMSWPAITAEALYKNSLNEVQNFLDKRNPDSYMVFNLCEKRRYSTSHFHGRVDHSICIGPLQSPLLVHMVDFCAKAKTWLDISPGNVVVVHSLYGRGRSAIMAAAWLLFSKPQYTAMSALREFSEKRALEAHTGTLLGVETPSQARYVHHFSRLMRQRNRIERLLESPTPALITRIELLSGEVGPDDDALSDRWSAVFTVFPIDGGKKEVFSLEASRIEDSDVIFEPDDVEVAGDIRLTIFRKKAPDDSLKPFCSLALHTSLLDSRGQIHFQKSDLDLLSTDLSHKLSCAAFAIRLEYVVGIPIQLT